MCTAYAMHAAVCYMVHISVANESHQVVWHSFNMCEERETEWESRYGIENRACWQSKGVLPVVVCLHELHKSPHIRSYTALHFTGARSRALQVNDIARRLSGERARFIEGGDATPTRTKSNDLIMIPTRCIMKVGVCLKWGGGEKGCFSSGRLTSIDTGNLLGTQTESERNTQLAAASTPACDYMPPQTHDIPVTD